LPEADETANVEIVVKNLQIIVKLHFYAGHFLAAIPFGKYTFSTMAVSLKPFSVF